jgi:hypothetical protein
MRACLIVEKDGNRPVRVCRNPVAQKNRAVYFDCPHTIIHEVSLDGAISDLRRANLLAAVVHVCSVHTFLHYLQGQVDAISPLFSPQIMAFREQGKDLAGQRI